MDHLHQRRRGGCALRYGDMEMKKEPMGHLVSSQNGVYCYHVLAKNFPLFVGFTGGKKQELSDFLLNNSDVMGAAYTLETVFNPDNPGWCENIDYLERLGLFVQSAMDETFWRIESIEGDIWAINPCAEWDDEADNYVVNEAQP